MLHKQPPEMKNPRAGSRFLYEYREAYKPMGLELPNVIFLGYRYLSTTSLHLRIPLVTD
jgi:hypothetical protein